jgi:hypothetical protein
MSNNHQCKASSKQQQCKVRQGASTTYKSKVKKKWVRTLKLVFSPDFIQNENNQFLM